MVGWPRAEGAAHQHPCRDDPDSVLRGERAIDQANRTAQRDRHRCILRVLLARTNVRLPQPRAVQERSGWLQCAALA